MSFYFHFQYYYHCFYQKKYLISLCFIYDFRNYHSLKYSIIIKNQSMDSSIIFIWFTAFIKMTTCNFFYCQCIQVFRERDWKCISPFPFTEVILPFLFIYSSNVLFITRFIYKEAHEFFYDFIKKVFLNFFLLIAYFYFLMFLS